jgi:hypothetical protein
MKEFDWPQKGTKDAKRGGEIADLQNVPGPFCAICAVDA